MPTPLLTCREAADYLRVSTRTLFNLTTPHGPIPCIRVGRGVRYSPAALQAWVDDQQSNRTAAVLQPATNRDAT